MSERQSPPMAPYEGLRAAGLLPVAEEAAGENEMPGDEVPGNEMSGGEMRKEAADETPAVPVTVPERRRVDAARRARWRFVSGVENRSCRRAGRPAARDRSERRPPAPREIPSRAMASTWTARARDWWQRKRAVA